MRWSAKHRRRPRPRHTSEWPITLSRGALLPGRVEQKRDDDDDDDDDEDDEDDGEDDDEDDGDGDGDGDDDND